MVIPGEELPHAGTVEWKRTGKNGDNEKTLGREKGKILASLKDELATQVGLHLFLHWRVIIALINSSTSFTITLQLAWIMALTSAPGTSPAWRKSVVPNDWSFRVSRG